jgi:HSP20 family protein
MYGIRNWSPFEEMLTVQRQFDRMFNQLWNELPSRSQGSGGPAFQVKSTDDHWRIELPMPGIDPQHVNIEAAGNSVTIRAEVPAEDGQGQPSRFEQSLTVPQFLDVEKLTANYRHGMLQLTLPLRESVKPRRIQIQSTGDDSRQISAGKDASRSSAA